MSREDTVCGNLPAHTGNDSKGSDVCNAAPDFAAPGNERAMGFTVADSLMVDVWVANVFDG
jgi:hypothetical protein